MNILFITLLDIRSIDEHNIYSDLMRQFAKNGHEVYIISPVERRQGMKTAFLSGEGEGIKSHVHILKLKTGNIQKTNIIEKGISTVLLEGTLKKGIKKYLGNVKFDLVLYSTPPITLVKPIKYIKKRDGAKTYLMLKDIFPQNAVDMGMMKKSGLKGVLYKSFRKKEKKLYELSDVIGCMSDANCDYLLKHNSEIEAERVTLCPNSIEIQDMTVDSVTRNSLREKYGIPLDKKVFVYGGNLGRPQGIPFIIECLEKQKNNKDAFFLIVGDGTEYGKLEDYFEKEKPTNMKLMKRLPKDAYDKMVAACDVGLIFLDYRFTIPNFPSRLLAYMQAGLPVIAATDPNTDIGKVITEGGFGWACLSNDSDKFAELVDKAVSADKADMAAKEFEYLKKEYSADKTYLGIMDSLK